MLRPDAAGIVSLNKMMAVAQQECERGGQPQSAPMNSGIHIVRSRLTIVVYGHDVIGHRSRGACPERIPGE